MSHPATYTLTLTNEQHLALLAAMVEVDTHIVRTSDGDSPVDYAWDAIQTALCFERTEVQS